MRVGRLTVCAPLGTGQVSHLFVWPWCAFSKRLCRVMCQDTRYETSNLRPGPARPLHMRASISWPGLLCSFVCESVPRFRSSLDGTSLVCRPSATLRLPRFTGWRFRRPAKSGPATEGLHDTVPRVRVNGYACLFFQHIRAAAHTRYFWTGGTMEMPKSLKDRFDYNKAIAYFDGAVKTCPYPECRKRKICTGGPRGSSRRFKGIPFCQLPKEMQFRDPYARFRV